MASILRMVSRAYKGRFTFRYRKLDKRKLHSPYYSEGSQFVSSLFEVFPVNKMMMTLL